MHTQRTFASECGKCGKVLDGAASEERVSPKPGDISVCAYCLCVSKFDDGLDLVPMTVEEQALLPRDEMAQINKYRAMLWLMGPGRKS